MRDRSEETKLAAVYIAVLAEAVAVALFLFMGLVWLAIWSGA